MNRDKLLRGVVEPKRFRDLRPGDLVYVERIPNVLESENVPYVGRVRRGKCNSPDPNEAIYVAFITPKGRLTKRGWWTHPRWCRRVTWGQFQAHLIAERLDLTHKLDPIDRRGVPYVTAKITTESR